MHQRTIEIIKGCLSDVSGFDVDDVSVDSRLREDLWIDSISVIKLFRALESNIPGFQVDVDELHDGIFQTLGSLASFVEKSMRKSGA